MIHPVDRLSDEELYALLMRADGAGFPADLDHLWGIERVRYRETLRRIPPAADHSARLLDLGSSRPWLPFFQHALGYRHIVLNTAYPDSGMVHTKLKAPDHDPADVSISVFDIERERFPHADNSFDLVLCLEVLEHLAIDPMAMMAEVNRVLKPGGLFILSTPNAVRCSNVVNILLGEHPLGWTQYNGIDTNRHNREYTPSEVIQLFQAAGIPTVETVTFGAKRRGRIRDLLRGLVATGLFFLPGCPRRWRRDVILAVGRRTSPVRDRKPSWLYFEPAEHVRTQKRGPAEDRQPVPALCS